MKRYIRYNFESPLTYIFGMASTRDAVISRLKSYSKTLTYHIIKCVIYGDSTGDLDHWIHDEICEYLAIANNLYIKPKNKKLKVIDYENSLFSMMGDSEIDAQNCLREFRLYNNRTSKYPAFDITSDMVDRLYSTFQSIIHKMCPILATSNNLDRDDFVSMIYSSIK